MKKQYNLAESHQNYYFQSKNKSKSPLDSVRKIPPTNVLQKTPPKHVPLMGVTFSTKTSTKTLGQLYQTHQKRKAKIHRNMTLQMEELCPRSEVDNAEERNLTPLSTKRDFEDQYFSRSLDKVVEVKSRKEANRISDQLNEVVNMIKEEKLKVGEKMKILKKNNEYYRRICEGEVVPTEQKGTNTIQILDCGEQRIYSQASAQVELKQLRAPQKQTAGEQVPTMPEIYADIYHKLCSMLDDMNIDYRQILPESKEMLQSGQSKSYKSLSEAEIIKIQKFFINKLTRKIYDK